MWTTTATWMRLRCHWVGGGRVRGQVGGGGGGGGGGAVREGVVVVVDFVVDGEVGGGDT